MQGDAELQDVSAQLWKKPLARMCSGFSRKDSGGGRGGRGHVTVQIQQPLKRRLGAGEGLRFITVSAIRGGRALCQPQGHLSLPTLVQDVSTKDKSLICASSPWQQ